MLRVVASCISILASRLASRASEVDAATTHSKTETPKRWSSCLGSDSRAMRDHLKGANFIDNGNVLRNGQRKRITGRKGFAYTAQAISNQGTFPKRGEYSSGARLSDILVVMGCVEDPVFS